MKSSLSQSVAAVLLLNGAAFAQTVDATLLAQCSGMAIPACPRRHQIRDPSARCHRRLLSNSNQRPRCLKHDATCCGNWTKHAGCGDAQRRTSIDSPSRRSAFAIEARRSSLTFAAQ